MTEFVDADLRGARFRRVDMTGVQMRGVYLVDGEIDGEIENLTINGVDIGPLVEAELDRRHPERAVYRATEPAELQSGWAGLEAMWAETIERAQVMPAGAIDASVDEEWSLVQTLRHLVLATDAWLNLTILQRERPFHPLGLLFAEAAGQEARFGLDADAVPTFGEVLDARAGRQALVREFLASVTPEQLAEPRVDPWGGSWQPTVLDCLRVIFNEEWQHHRYAIRDLATL